MLLIESKLARTPFGVVRVRRKLALLFQIIEPRRVRRAILQERRIKTPHLLEGAIVKDKALALVKYGDALSQVIERIVMRTLLARHGFVCRFALGDIDRKPCSAAGNRADAQAQRTQLSVNNGRARFFDSFAGFDGFARQIDCGLVQLQIALDGLRQRLGIQRAEIGRVRPLQLQRTIDAPRHERRFVPHFEERGRIARDDFRRAFDAAASATLFDTANAGVENPNNSARTGSAAIDFDVNAIRRRDREREWRALAAQALQRRRKTRHHASGAARVETCEAL